MEVDGLQPCLHIEAGAAFLDSWEVSMAYYLGIGVVGAEASE